MCLFTTRPGRITYCTDCWDAARAPGSKHDYPATLAIIGSRHHNDPLATANGDIAKRHSICAPRAARGDGEYALYSGTKLAFERAHTAIRERMRNATPLLGTLLPGRHLRSYHAGTLSHSELCLSTPGLAFR